MAIENKCKHEACSCQAVNGSEFCSDHCRDAVEQDIIEIACDCGHGGC
jgi:hypothetical protein